MKGICPIISLQLGDANSLSFGVLSLAKILCEEHALMGKTTEDGRKPPRNLTDSNYTACCYQGDSAGYNDEFPDDGDHTRSRMILH